MDNNQNTNGNGSVPGGSMGSPAPAMAAGGGAVSAPTPPAPPTPREMDINLTDVLTVGDVSAPISDMVEAYRRARQQPQQPAVTTPTPQVPISSGQPNFVETLYQRAVSGDRTAAQQLLAMAYPQAPAPVQTTPPPTPAPQTPTTIAGMTEQELREIKSYVDQQKNTSIKAGLASQIQTLGLTALAARDDAVDQVISQMDAQVRLFVGQANREPTQIEAGQILKTVMTELNNREAAYQRKLLGQNGSPNAGSLGVPDPFRGGASQVVVGERPTPGTKEYTKWLNAKFNLARAADSMAS